MKDDREKLIVATLDKIRHFLQRDGGDVEFVSFEEGVVYVKLHGACQDCAYANSDIKDLVEKGVLRKNDEGGRSTNYSLVTE